MTLRLNGLAGSPGIYVGHALVPEQPKAALDHPGGVLVLKTANMEWLEAITSAGAVVTEVGGRTSHAAMICRELGKPCVTAVADITSKVRPGALLAVDGAAGEVTVLS